MKPGTADPKTLVGNGDNDSADPTQAPYMGTEEDRPVHSGRSLKTYGTQPASNSGDDKDPVDPRR